MSDYEIICVDDGSPDKSATIAKELSKEYLNIRVITQTNQGLSGARNTGLQNAIGDYVWFVDSDDWIREKCLKKITDVCVERNLDVLQICAANIYGDKVLRRFSYNDEKSVYSGIDALKRGIPSCAPFSIYKRDFLKGHGLQFYLGIFHEDNEFTPRVFYYAERVSSLNDILYFVYQNPNSITRTVNPKKAFDCLIVLNRLHDFMEGMKDDAKIPFHRLITGTFNAALHNTLCVSEENIKNFNEELSKNRHLYTHLFKSGQLIYQIEWALLKILPQHPVMVYHIMSCFDGRKKK